MLLLCNELQEDELGMDKSKMLLLSRNKLQEDENMAKGCNHQDRKAKMEKQRRMQRVDAHDAPPVLAPRMLPCQDCAAKALLNSISTELDHGTCRPTGAGSGQRLSSSGVVGQ